MEQPKEHFFSESLQKLKDYGNDRMLLLKLQTVEQASKALAAIVSVVLLTVFAGFVLLFLSVSAAFFLASSTGSTGIGFAIVAGIYLLLFLIVFFAGKMFLRRIITNAVISYCFNKDEHEQSETDNQPE